MAGIGANIFAGLGSGGAPSGGTSPTVSNSAASYGPATSPANVGPLSPRHGFGMGFWFGVGGLAVLVLIRQTLPR